MRDSAAVSTQPAWLVEDHPHDPGDERHDQGRAAEKAGGADPGELRTPALIQCARRGRSSQKQAALRGLLPPFAAEPSGGGPFVVFVERCSFTLVEKGAGALKKLIHHRRVLRNETARRGWFPNAPAGTAGMKHNLTLVILTPEQVARAREANGSRKRITHALVCGPYGQMFGAERQCLKCFTAWVSAAAADERATWPLAHLDRHCQADTARDERVLRPRRAQNRDAFVIYVEQVMVPELRPGDGVILDNLPSHKGPKVRNVIHAACAELVFLPPYSTGLQSNRARLFQAQGPPLKGRRAHHQRPLGCRRTHPRYLLTIPMSQLLREPRAPPRLLPALQR